MTALTNFIKDQEKHLEATKTLHKQQAEPAVLVLARAVQEELEEIKKNLYLHLKFNVVDYDWLGEVEVTIRETSPLSTNLSPSEGLKKFRDESEAGW